MTKTRKILYWVATGWLALGMLSTGIVQLCKIAEGQGGADMMARLGYPAYLLPMLGTCKILGVVAILMPRLPLLKEWAYAGFVFIMCGALFSHIITGEPVREMLPSLLLLVLTFLSWYLRPAGRKIISANFNN